MYLMLNLGLNCAWITGVGILDLKKEINGNAAAMENLDFPGMETKTRRRRLFSLALSGKCLGTYHEIEDGRFFIYKK